MSDQEIALYPAWRQAVQDFTEAGFVPGDVISHGWLAEHFGMPVLDDAAALTVAQYQARQFEWLENIEAMKKALLEQYQICLVSVPGHGWRWVPPQEQTDTAVKHFEREAKRVYRKAGARLMHVRVAELTDAQRQENMDAIGRLSMLQGMHRSLE